MSKRILITGISFFFFFATFAAQVNPEKAARVARNFFYERSGYTKALAYSSVKPVLAEQRKENGETIFYAFNVGDNGFVLVSGDDQLIPVLGYSFESEWGQSPMPVQLNGWLDHYKAQIQYTRSHKLPADINIQHDWERLTTSDDAILKPVKNVNNTVGPLLISTWNQGDLYNALCPADPAGPGGKVYAGCVATAMAQVMYYYRWPRTGTGSHGYNSDYGWLNVNFSNAIYKWEEMQNSISSPNNAVALISYHCGVAVDMMYAPDGSGAYSWDAAEAMKNYFRYSQNTQFVDKEDYTDVAWADMIKAQLDSKKPLYYHGFGSGGGHAFNLDGYQDGNFFHFNWGWGGSYNGYFYLNNLNPGYNFSNGQGAIIDIFPAGEYPPSCAGSTNFTALKGTIDDGSGPLNYAGNNDCYYLINPQVSPQDSISNIILKFNLFETEDGQDIVNIYDGPTTASPLIGSYTGNTIPATITSANNKVLIHFTSDNIQHKNGWFISYEAKAPVFCHPMDLVTAVSGTLEDGSGPKNYQDKVICQWLINPANAQSVTLSFDEFHLENTGDVVEVYAFDPQINNGTLLGQFSGAIIPPDVTSYTGSMFIIFQTNASNTAQGWKAHYSSQAVGLQENSILENLSISPNPAQQYVNVSFNAECSDAVVVSLYASAGNEVSAWRIEPQNGLFSHRLELGELAKGVYFMRLHSCKGDSMHKLVIH